MIHSLLIANRGEIACRIIRTARRLGVRTVAVYSDADADALHVRQADKAVHIGPSPAAESYLRGDAIIAAAKQTGAEAIHPGYGFLSENADFAQAVLDAGLIWVGPKPASIRAMGLKDSAKARMAAAGVPTTPGYLGEDQAPDRLASEADAIGYPVLIKAVAGGGGKGMRRVDDAGGFADALASAKREAAASFGNDHVLLEKWITSPRHIEVQVFGDSHGTVVHLFERDCSLQRRHQKVIEEAPAPGMDAATREQVCGAAVRAAKAVDYEGAGTIEFIADASEGLRADRIWFMEMNTRLQVEHPVTEEITGVDLVEWQLRVASGEPIPLRQDELAINGWAMEARLYAEDPANGFLPSVGRLEHLDLSTFPAPHEVLANVEAGPTEEWEDDLPTTRVRVETGVAAGGAVSSFYDPMIAKLVAHGRTRDEARAALERQCAAVQVWPIRTNAAFLVQLLRSPDFIRGGVETGFIAARLDELIGSGGPKAAIGTAALRLMQVGSPSAVPFGGRELAGLRLNAEARTTAAVSVDGVTVAAPVPGPVPVMGGVWNALPIVRADGGVVVFADGAAHLCSLATRPTGGASASDGTVLSPMPGKVTAVAVADGQAVAKGDTLVVMEAMKMEQALVAPFNGTVAELTVAVGDQVKERVALVRVEKGPD